MDLEKIAELIKKKRKEKNLTQEQLAKKLNVTEKAISRWETGRGTPDISLLIPLAKALDVNVSEILEGKEDKTINKNIEEILEYIDVSKKRKNTKLIILAIIFYIITLLLYLSYLKIEYTQKIGLSYTSEIIFYLIFTILIFIPNSILANHYFDKKQDKEKMKKITLVILLILYSILIFNLTIFGREVGEIRSNLIPFKTITNYFLNFHKFNLNIIGINIIGNFVIFMPIQYFIMQISNIKNWRVIIIIDILIILGVEFLQFITHTGIFDVDDIILNLTGMLIAYLSIQFYEKRKNKKELLQSK